MISLPSPSPASSNTKFLVAFLLAGAGLAAIFAPPAARAAAQTGLVSVLHNFTGTNEAGAAEDMAVTGLIKGTDGNFYGITRSGGANGNGTVYKLTPAGAYSVLHNFYDNSDASPPGTEGNSPQALIQATDGNLYGICNDGGLNPSTPNGAGTIFKLTLAGVYTKLYDFDKGPGNEPEIPVAFVQGKDGNFYGLTRYGGKTGDDDGTFFRFVAGTKTLTELFAFVRSGSTVGIEPLAQLLVGKDGKFYGTTTNVGGVAGSQTRGTIFKATTAGAVTLVHAFTNDSDNPHPTPEGDKNSLIQGTDGNFYGASTFAGTDDYGTIYRCTPAGVLTVLHDFTDGADGAYPGGGLAQGADGNFYGGLQAGFPAAGSSLIGPGGYYQIRAGGAFTILHKFDPKTTTGPVIAYGKLFEVSKGTFYGVTGGGTAEDGTITKLVVSPAIVSALTATATLNQSFSYQIAASNSPTGFGAQGLPAGLTVNATTGLISGKPTKAGTFAITLNASNAAGKGSATLTLTVKAASAAPVITSAKTASGKAGTAFSYQITASGNPTSFGVQGLPAGLAVNATTGLISGTPQVGGTSTLTVNAYNAAGKGSATVTLTIANGPPVITSAKTASGKVGVAFSYQIKASGSPTGYGVQGLPAGLTINGTTGLISGTPAKAGTSTLTLNAYNSLGKGSASLTLTVSAQ